MPSALMGGISMIANMKSPASVKRVPGLQWDYRLGGVPRLVRATDEELMQIPDAIRKCVAFLALKRNSGYKIKGTVFFVGYPLDDVDSAVVYAITARHVIEEINKHGNDGKVYCRMNTRHRAFEFVPTDLSQWVFNDDQRIDVAVAPMQIEFTDWDHEVLPSHIFLAQDRITKEGIGVGDDVFFPGLFSERPGEKANIPIVRIGNIVAMPEEPIQTESGWLKSPYLVEARSIGGLSGSPVLWYCGPQWKKPNPTYLYLDSPRYLLLGLVHGHYGVKEEFDSSNDTSSDVVETRSINMGIAIVVPISDVLDTLNKPELRRQRETIRQTILALKGLSLPVPDPIGEATAEMFVQEDVIAQPESVSGLFGAFSTNTISVQPDNQEGQRGQAQILDDMRKLGRGR